MVTKLVDAPNNDEFVAADAPAVSRLSTVALRERVYAESQGCYVDSRCHRRSFTFSIPHHAISLDHLSNVRVP